ncbi:hypothetical protein QNH39_10360 [Neobacillus novalis]|uniref:IPT/TIG domain-containing protein n=1 Tax=Neobacillus novalis TaxID=220687 RepID=A0AA95MTF4_9BACI|nr:hypothetical protein [Neobacillus novalis]WHY88209.1 hypothetical protein QNH39_10360 [Neobacillus novalis]
MPILPPKVIGPLSECSSSVVFENAQPGAYVYLLRTRNGVTTEVGKQQATQSSGAIPLLGEEFIAGDLVGIFQATDLEKSDSYSTLIEVQNSAGMFNPAQVLTHVYKCARGLILGAMKPGTKVEILRAGSVIGTGEATDGHAYVNFGPVGITANVGTTLTVRQRVCPKPPPPGGALEWIIDHPLPPVEPLPVSIPSGTLVPYPTITKGLAACSRAVEVSGIIPGAEIFVEDGDGGWWSWKGASDQTVVWMHLPVGLVEGRKVKVRQELGCEMKSDHQYQIVGAQEALAKPELGQIDCHTVPEVLVSGLKPEVNVEFEVVYQGQTQIYTTVATIENGTDNQNIPIPAPPMPVGAAVRVRQGECNSWSEWSNAVTANVLAEPPHTPEISSELFQCQNTISVNNIFPAGGTVRVMSKFLGEIANVQNTGNADMLIPVSPSLLSDDGIFVEYSLCGFKTTSEIKQVQPLGDVFFGHIHEPLYDGDTSVILGDITASAFVELWDQKVRLAAGYAPFSHDNSGRVKMEFSNLAPLRSGQTIFTKIWHCGQYRQSRPVSVKYRPPIVEDFEPRSLRADGVNGPFSLVIFGKNFLVGATARWSGSNLSTTFNSSQVLEASIPANIRNQPQIGTITVINPDGQVSNSKQYEIKAPSPPPPPPSPIIQASIGYSGQNLDTVLTVTGSMFKANENVYIVIEKQDVVDANHNGDYTEYLPYSDGSTQANGLGQIKFEIGVYCVSGMSNNYRVLATGDSSGDSNFAKASC